MGRIFYLMGKSSTGKDTIYKSLMADAEVNCKAVVPYTTRPIRAGETEGAEYHFTNDRTLDKIRESGKLVEERSYDTCLGIWHYFTVDDGQIDLEKQDYLMIGTLQSYEKSREYFGEHRLVPVLIELEDGKRLQRALDRERQQEKPRYDELCRRFLADREDFSEERLQGAGIDRSFTNDDLESCIAEIKGYIQEVRQRGKR